jgi:hypothetical protein
MPHVEKHHVKDDLRFHRRELLARRCADLKHAPCVLGFDVLCRRIVCFRMRAVQDYFYPLPTA